MQVLHLIAVKAALDQVEQNDAILLNNHQEKVAMFDSNFLSLVK